MDTELDDDQRALSVALRARLGRVGEDDGRWVDQVLADLSLFSLEIPAWAGGLEFGLRMGVIVCEELGRQAARDGYRASALLADLLATGDNALSAEILGKITVGSLPVATVGWDAPIRLGGPATAPVLSGRFRLSAQDGAAVLVVPAAGEHGRVLAACSADSRGVQVASGRLAESRLDGAAAAPVRPVMNAAGQPDAVLVRAWIRQAAYLLGLAAGAHRLAVIRAARRRQFGTVIADNQAVMFPLARQFAGTQALRLLVHRAAWLMDQQDEASGAGAEALAYAAEVALETTAWAIHVHGASGLSRGEHVHRYYDLAAAEAVRWGTPSTLWREAARLRGFPASPAPQPRP
jgi:alkylation response protein AidB-like acyl-CoA dehydrogenase